MLSELEESDDVIRRRLVDNRWKGWDHWNWGTGAVTSLRGKQSALEEITPLRFVHVYVVPLVAFCTCDY